MVATAPYPRRVRDTGPEARAALVAAFERSEAAKRAAGYGRA